MSALESVMASVMVSAQGKAAATEPASALETGLVSAREWVKGWATESVTALVMLSAQGKAAATAPASALETGLVSAQEWVKEWATG